jgi:hypothetical protein
VDQTIHQMALQSYIGEDSALVRISVADSNYASEIISQVFFSEPLVLISDVQLHDFRLGNLLNLDSSLSISARTNSRIVIDQSSLEGYVVSDSILLRNQSMKYELDTMTFHALVSPTNSKISYYSNDTRANLISNFDLRDASEVIGNWSNGLLTVPDSGIHADGMKSASFNFELENASIAKVLGIDVDDFSSLQVAGKFDERDRTSTLQAASGKFKGYGASCDTLSADFHMLRDSLSICVRADNWYYVSVRLGNLDFDVLAKSGTAIANLQLADDSLTLLGLTARMLRTDTGTFVYTDKLRVFDHDYSIDPANRVQLVGR